MAIPKRILYIIFCLVGILINKQLLANNDGFPPGQYDVHLNGRPGSPYPALDNYNTDLSAHGVGASYTVHVTRHHIIPYNVLAQFYNNIFYRSPSDYIQLRGFFTTFGRNIGNYAGSSGVNCNQALNAAGLAEAMTLADAISYNYVTPGFYEHEPDGIDGFQAFYAWLPGNLFIGPTNRTDDPGDGFEVNAREIVGNENYQILLRLYNNMVDYNAGNYEASTLRSIAADLTSLAQRQGLYQLNNLNWIREQSGYYRIRTPHDELRRRRDVTNANLFPKSSSEQCTKIKSNFASMYPRYIIPVTSYSFLMD